jgi:hypothetical protein
MKAAIQMKVTESEPTFNGAAKLARRGMLLAVCLLAGPVAQAHLTYSGRDLGAYSGLTNGTLTITNQAVSGNYGWADAADGVLGDSHRARAFRFRLENSALVTLTVAANPRATTNSLGGFTPAFSVYSGLAAVAPFSGTQTGADHDGSVAALAWRKWWVQQYLNPHAVDESPTDGSWNALGDFKIGGDGDPAGDFAQLSSLNYKGSAASTTSGGTVTGSFALTSGDYTVLVGGNDFANKTSNTALSPHGIAVTLAVTPAPVLSITKKVFVAWPPGTAANLVLQSATSLHNATWSNVTNAPVTVYGQHGVLLDGSASQLFFHFNPLQ